MRIHGHLCGINTGLEYVCQPRSLLLDTQVQISLLPPQTTRPLRAHEDIQGVTTYFSLQRSVFLHLNIPLSSAACFPTLSSIPTPGLTGVPYCPLVLAQHNRVETPGGWQTRQPFHLSNLQPCKPPTSAFIQRNLKGLKGGPTHLTDPTAGNQKCLFGMIPFYLDI